MLLYHFPLNTQESIENFTNKGIKTTDVAVGNGFVQQSDGKISNLSAYCNQSSYGCMRIDNLSGYDKMSIAFRIKLAGTEDRYQSLLWSEVTPNSSDSTRIYIQASANSSSCTFHLPNTSLSNKILYPSVWYDIVLIKNNSTFSFYINGEYYGNATNQNYNISTLYFGNREIGSAGKFTKGMFQDIRIYDHALSQVEINEYSRALVVHYPLQGNELNQSVLKDVSGLGNDTFGEGTTPFQYVGGSPRAMKWTSFNGDKQQYKVADLVTCMYDNFSVAMWFACDVGSTDQFLLSQGRNWIGSTNDNYGFNIEISANDRLIIKIGGSSIHITDITISTIYHVAVTYSNYVCKTYVNGELLNTTTLSLAPVYKSSNTPDVLCIGKVAYGYNFPAGGYYPSYCRQSDVRIYATALSAEDIKNLYNSPISVTKQHQTMAFEFKENPLYPSKYWRTPTYAEMYYILNTRTNASSLICVGRVNIGNNTYRNGTFILPDDWTTPSGITMTIQQTSFSTNTYTLEELKLIEDRGAIFFVSSGMSSNGASSIININANCQMWLDGVKCFNARQGGVVMFSCSNYRLLSIRLCHSAQGQHTFSTSASTSIKFAKSNLQYHCTLHKWRFAEHSYDYIGSANANISPTYNGWIDLFGYGTSGVNYAPTLHSTTNSDYASGDISNTDNDWGINEIQSYDYNVKNFAANKNGIVQHNELRENDSEVNGCYNDKLITNELIEN